MSDSNKLPNADRRLTNLTNALYITDTNDIAIRTGINGDIIISGTVNIPGTITVNSTPADPVHVHVTEIGTSGLLDVPYLPIQGTVNIGDNGTVSLSSSTLNALERVIVDQSPTPWIISKDANANSNANPLYVNFTNNTIGVTGSFWQATQPVSIASMPSTPVTGTFWQATQPVSIASMPSTPVTGTFWQATQPVSGTVTANVTFPTTQNVSIMKNGEAVSDTVALPTRVLNDENLIAYARSKAVTETEFLSAYLIDKSGATESLGTDPTTMTTVWSYSGIYPWNTFSGSGDKLYVKSLIDDPKVRGATIFLEGLNSSYNLISETVTLDGSNTTTAVASTQNFYRLVAATLTSNNTNYLPHDSDIRVYYGSSSGTVVGQLQAPYGKTQGCTYTVPAGYEAFILSVNGSSGKSDEITSMIWTRPFNKAWHQIKSFKFISGSFDHNFRTPYRIPEKSDIEIRAYALVESSRIGTEFQMLIIPKA